MTSHPREGRGDHRAVLVTCLVFGLLYLVTGVVTDQVGFGLFGLGIMLAYAAVLELGRRRVEALALLAGDVSDERQAGITQRASAFTAQVLVVVLVASFLVTLASGSDLAGVFAALCAVGAVAFLSGIVWHSRRG